MEMQIDLVPNAASYTVNLYIDGRCFQMICSQGTAQDFVRDGIVKQVTGKRRIGDTEELEEFEYENGVDSAGVQYASKVFNLVEQKS